MPNKRRKLRSVAANEPIHLSDIVSPEGIHPSQTQFEDEFETLLDEMGDAEFGDIQLKEQAEAPATLKNWSSQDFANIYTRFRPHLERYAKRWLNNQSQIDEVVQDAFLYLMVTLPELDSEIGVLRFLKWKTRLLCLDVIRASGRAVINNIDDHELAADVPESSAALEAADDAAVVRLALSKLTPRHREVLIATMYEEKSISEVATQVALSENATRQLLFRARSAFKVALVGEVDTNGMSMGSILSVAGRKAASEVRTQGAKALVSLFVLVLAIGSYFTFTGRNQATEAPVAEAPAASTPAKGATAAQEAPSTPVHIVASAPKPHPSATAVEVVSEPKHTIIYDPSVAVSGEGRGYFNAAALKSAVKPGQNQTVDVYPSGFGAASLTAGAPTRYGIATTSETGNSLSSYFRYSQTAGASEMTVTVLAGGLQYFAYVNNVATSQDANGNLVITGLLGDLIDGQNVVLNGTDLRGATVTLTLQQSTLTTAVQSANLLIAPLAK